MQLAVQTLMPYMISAVIAAITAIGVMTILPTTRVVEPTRQLVIRLNEVAAGDLTTRVRLHADDPLREVANSFNAAVGEMGSQIAAWKVINRQQWGVLCHIRHAVEMGNMQEALQHVKQMERNWDKIAEIEERFEA
ncbi:HAMP domain-containing protein [candidate division GN15 bacterium]|nr:HAMP domain-containing protein [candidate division GN15 bacterium]